MDRNYPTDMIDGVEVPPTVITGDGSISGTHNGSVYVESGCATVIGTLNGSLHVSAGCSANIRGTHNGSLLVEPDADVTVSGAHNGSTHVGQDATVVVEARGKLAGSLDNNGLVILRGVFGGAESGDGELRVEPSGRVKQPVILKDGTHVYKWSSN